MYLVYQKSNRSPRRVFREQFTYVISWDGRIQNGASHAALLCRRCATTISRTWRHRDKPHVEIFFDFPPPPYERTHGTFRVFMIGIQDATKDPRSRWNVKFVLWCVIKAFSVPVDNESMKGSVIYDHHCNESPWMSLDATNRSLISMNMFTQVESITTMCYAEYQCWISSWPRFIGIFIVIN